MREPYPSLPLPLIQTDTTDAVLEWRVASDLLRFSLGAKRLLGVEANTHCSMAAFLGACHEDKRDILGQSLQTFLEGHIGAHMEICFPINGLVARTQLITLARDGAGQAEHVVGCISAVERQAQQILPSARFSMQHLATPHSTQDAARLMLALNASGDGLWDWDANTNTVYYSPRYIEMLGYSDETFPATLRSWEEKIHPEDYAHGRSARQASAASGQTRTCQVLLPDPGGNRAANLCVLCERRHPCS